MPWMSPGDEPDAPLPCAAARGVVLAVLLSSALWIGLALTLWTLI